MRGKQTCRILKQIRAEIARQNDIDLTVHECTFQGECKGTCPRCESEVRYLEEQLQRRRSLKKAVALAGISAGVIAALSGCQLVNAAVDAAVSAKNPPAEEAPADDAPQFVEGMVLTGDVVACDPQQTGEPQESEEFPLTGDVIYEEEP